MSLIFTKRAKNKSPNHQITFWAKAELYQNFVASVKKEGLYITHVFENFMGWFIKAQESGKLIVIDYKNKEGEIEK